MSKRKERPTLEQLQAEYGARGLTVNEVTKTVRGNRYLYARVWDKRAQAQRDIYLGPVRPKTLRGILTEKDVRSLRTIFKYYDNEGRHPAYTEALGKVLKAYRAEE